MKKRVIAAVFLSVMLLTTICVPALAFPFSDYNAEKNNVYVHYYYDSETDDDKLLADQGLMYARTITCTGYSGAARRSDKVYEQSCRLTVKLPEGFFYPGNSHASDPENYTFRASESGSFFKFYEEEGYQKYSHNDVEWVIYHEIHEVNLYSPERGETLQQAMDKKAEQYKDIVYDSWYSTDYIGNTARTPVSVERDANGGYKIITNGFFDDTKYWSINEEWGGFKESYLEGRYYTLITPVRELDNTYIVIVFRQRRSFKATIEGPAHADYRAEYDKGKSRTEEYWSKDIGGQILNLNALMSIVWAEPTVTPSAQGSTEETNETRESATSHAGVTQWAEEEAGEDGGVSVPAAIVIGVVGGGAAVAGAAAALSGKDDVRDDEKKKKSYKMYVQKDFGDAIRRGGKPVKVRSRIAEVSPGGGERERNDLTAQISVSADGMNVHGSAMAGRYLEAVVSVPEDNENDTAKITFTFTGEGGSFANTVVFRVIDGPSLVFLQEIGNSGSFERMTANRTIGMIPGDGFTYEEYFMIEDAPVPPELADISADKAEGCDAAFEKTEKPSVYKLIVKNNTPALPEKEKDVFAQPERRSFDIHVRVQDEDKPLEGSVTLCLYPEGITVSSRQEGEKNSVRYMRVQAYEKEHVGDLDRKWQVSEMKITLAVPGDGKAVINPKEVEYKFDKLKGSGGKGTWYDHEQSLAEKYEYKQSWGEWNDDFIYTFEPNATLVEPDNGFFLVLLPVSASYDGRTYEAEVPIRLRGRDIDPMEAWEKEYAKLKERIEKFSLPENKDFWLKKFEELANDPIPSVEELRLTSKYVIRQYMRYWTVESMKARDDAEVYDIIVDYLEWTKFFGDVAFSILVNLYAGPVAEALISPAKDFFAGAIGEVIAAWNHGQKIDVDKFEFSKNLAAAGDNLVSGAIDITNWKKAAATLGCYFAYASVKNFILTLREKNKFDVYGAIVKGFSDMTSAALKAAAAQLFSAWLKNCNGFRRKASAWCGKFVTKNLGEGKFIDMRNMDGLVKDDILRKYVDGLFGKGVDKLMEVAGDVHDKIVESQTGFEFGENGHVIATFYFDLEKLDKHYLCSVDVTEALTNTADLMTGGLFSFVYDEIFGNVPAAAAVVTVPKDPPLPPEAGKK